MDDGPRQRRTNAWAWVDLALFGSENDGTGADGESTDRAGGAGPEASDGPETR
jgi:hypothetical protein